jgi:hypothetical protein
MKSTLIGAKYIKNKYGPTPVDFAKIIKQMQKADDYEEIRTKYLPKRPADLFGLSK